MKKAWKIFRAFILALIFVLIAVPVSLYIILSTEWAQNDIRRVAVSELSALLGTEVTLGKIEIHPFNELSIHDVEAEDDFGKTALRIDQISVGFELLHLLRTGHLVVNYALVDGPELMLYKTSADSPLNIAQIIDNLKSDRPSKPQSHYDLMVSSVIIRKGSLRFDIHDAPSRDSIFDPAHIFVYDVLLHAHIPRISNDEYRVEIDRFSLTEQTGFRLTDLTAAAHITPDGSELEYLSLRFPNSHISIAPVKLENQGFSGLEQIFKSEGIDIGINPGSTIYPPDFSCFYQPLASLNDSVEIILSGSFSADHAIIKPLTLTQSSGNYLATLSVSVNNLASGVESPYSLDYLRFSANESGVKSLLGVLGDLKNKTVENVIGNLKPGDTLSSSVTASGKISDSKIDAKVAFADNAVELSAHYSTPDTFKTIGYSMNSKLSFRDLRSLIGDKAPSALNVSLNVAGHHGRHSDKLVLTADSSSVDYSGHRYGPISAALSMNNKDFEVDFNLLDPMATIVAECTAELGPGTKHISASVDVEQLNPHGLMLTDKYEGYKLSASTAANLEFSSIDDISGYLTLTDIDFSDEDPVSADFKLKAFTIESAPIDDEPGLNIQSDFLNATIDGSYRFTTLYADLKEIVEMVFPAIKSNEHPTTIKTAPDNLTNNFTYHIAITECENLCHFFNLPLSVIYPIELEGHLSAEKKSASAILNAPYILQGDKIIENTVLNADINGENNRAVVSLTTKMPTKKGPMTASAELIGSSDRLDSKINWAIERKIPINGSFNFTTDLFRNFDNSLSTAITFHPGTITFGNDIWTVNPSTISLSPDKYDIQHFALTSEGKSIAINGVVSNSPDDSIDVKLSNIALLDIFETLEIDKALIGGTATGDFAGRALLSKQPEIYSDNLHVKNISYNKCVLGDADIKAKWDNDKGSFYLDADITGDTGLHSYINGDIYPAGEALDISFDANHIPVGFMKPFMEAFASDLTGHASGKARLFGTFKYIDMEGDIFADNLKIKIAFTNTWYTATDNIKLRPGVIDINNVTIKDINGNTARLNGVVHHTFFKEPSFNFTVTDARNFLSYDVDSRLSPDWYGTIYGNGGATINGEPGVVNIGVNMSTAPKSTFTFVLSDRLDADEYSFITFKDSRAEARRDSLLKADNLPTAVRLLRERLGTENSNTSSAYNMDLQIDITPEARITLVMDPVSGDEIKATGAGNLRMAYGSQNNDLKIYGTYTLNRGSYNFTLQDIIIKDFTIKEGSSIAFHGDPYSAQLDIEAIYAVNANLSDLDESFLLDKDLNRTNVPVHALLKVTGDMRQPDIDFDLEFPTLTQDIYRKVRSIVSTKDMMNRQIIYLLALNRFYTPDYMASTTKGNELFSVASSTIASQLSSMLGKLSDDWSIAPNLRSDRGDFSDVEVDVALSSRLLNNRLLFNGNFGYRDKTLNTNQFIGDFDIEYLLNPKGSWRLKAYNRYNDQNYYVRTAQTTQGVGLVFKKDFDNFFGFLHPKKRKTVTLPKDSIAPQPAISIPDSIAHPADPLLQK